MGIFVISEKERSLFLELTRQGGKILGLFITHRTQSSTQTTTHLQPSTTSTNNHVLLLLPVVGFSPENHPPENQLQEALSHHDEAVQDEVLHPQTLHRHAFVLAELLRSRLIYDASKKILLSSSLFA